MKRSFLLIFCLFSLMFFCSSICGADVQLGSLFCDHMVLQQNEDVCIWGWADPGEEVSITADWKSVVISTTADSNGDWSLGCKTPGAGGPYKLVIQGKNTITLSDVLIGEVWVCSGQSNMEYTLAGLGDEKNLKALQECSDSKIRLFNVSNQTSSTPLKKCGGQWQVCDPKSLRHFSAVGYYFGKNLHEQINVPIGLIGTNWGGTPAEAWTSEDGLKQFSRFASKLEYLKDADKLKRDFESKFNKGMARWSENIGKVDVGIQQGWDKALVNESEWNEIYQPKGWSSIPDLRKIDGIVWFRRSFSLPQALSGKDLQLHLGTIDDVDTVWINGVNIGTTARGWAVKRVYAIPASALKEGDNSIAVRVIDQQGNGGLTGGKDDLRIGLPGADIANCVVLSGIWKYKISCKGRVASPPGSEFRVNQNSPTVLYNAMVSPLIPYKIAGVIWYQGEANRYDGRLYGDLFPAMISDWRGKWGQGDFPFYFVQIAPYEYRDSSSSGLLREAQMLTMSKLPNVGMAVTMDIGEENNIHPKNKHDVGDRLARWALAKVYDRDVEYSGPLYKSMKVEDNKIRVSFDCVEGELIAKGGELTDFTIAGADQNFVTARAAIDGNTVVVWSPEVAKPVAVRYGWADWCRPNLFNKAGLPASSFRTDDWSM